MKRFNVLFLKGKLLVLVFLLYIVPAAGQLVNIESKRQSVNDTLKGYLDVSAEFSKSTKEVIQGKTNIGLQWDSGPHTVLALNELSWMQVDGEDIKNNRMEHFRYNYTFRDTGRTTIEAFLQHQNNALKMLKRRFVLGAGPRFEVIKTPGATLNLCPLVIWEYETLSTEAETETRLLRGDFYVSGGVDFTEYFGLTHVTYYQPDLAKWKDLRIYSDTRLWIKVSDRFSFTITYNFSYDSDPPDEIPNIFYSLKNGIEFRF